MSRYELVIDHAACWGCRTCEVACKQEFHLPGGTRLLSVEEDGPRFVDGRPEFRFRVRVCRHCDEPPCAEACPEEAIRQREDGIVVLDALQCSGCGACVDACPFEAIAFDTDADVARKCNLCHHRIDQGLIPACLDNVCLSHCMGLGVRDETGRVVPAVPGPLSAGWFRAAAPRGAGTP